jgi:hypothetical protein
MNSIKHWFHTLFRPSITSVNVTLYDNGKERPITLYEANRAYAIMESINNLWQPQEKSSYWFETELHEHHSCFKKTHATLHVVCYREDYMANTFKSETGIPNKYRVKMFDRPHPLRPEQVGSIPWSPNLTVIFTL